MSLLDWLKPRKLAPLRRSNAVDPAAKLIRDLIAMRMPMSLATFKAASDAAASGTAGDKPPAAVGDRLPPIACCAITSIGVTPVF